MIKYAKKELKSKITLRKFHNQRNKILIMREVGGLGDILMHRMMFEDFKLLIPDATIVFACSQQYFQAVDDHPFIDELVDCSQTNPKDYMISYNTSTACGRYEMKIAPLADLHRSDIWANHCGVNLTRHNMHINLEDEHKEYGKSQLKKIKNQDGPNVLLCPVSAMANKNLLPHQIEGTVNELRKLGYFVYAVHRSPIETLTKLNVPVIYGTSIKQWMGVIDAADYVISVDTSSFHFAGGISKPLVGIFTFADGLVYGKYYPTATIVQKHRKKDPLWICGPCYNWSVCPKTNSPLKPCLTELTTEMIIDGAKEMFAKFPTISQ